MIKVTATTDVELTPELIAMAFCEMSDEAQADFFIHADRIARESFDGPPCFQWQNIGEHLRKCECSTDGARDMVRQIAYGVGDA